MVTCKLGVKFYRATVTWHGNLGLEAGNGAIMVEALHTEKKKKKEGCQKRQTPAANRSPDCHRSFDCRQV